LIIFSEKNYHKTVKEKKISGFKIIKKQPSVSSIKK
jgi:hypothetical protein